MIRLVFSAGAEADLEEIGDYIARDNIDAAIAFVERIRERCQQLAEYPGIGRRRSDLRSGYRAVAEGDYIILYVVSGDVVQIVRVLHGKRDIGTTLK